MCTYFLYVVLLRWSSHLGGVKYSVLCLSSHRYTTLLCNRHQHLNLDTFDMGKSVDTSCWAVHAVQFVPRKSARLILFGTSVLPSAFLFLHSMFSSPHNFGSPLIMYHVYITHCTHTMFLSWAFLQAVCVCMTAVPCEWIVNEILALVLG